jgi:molybdopterin biosynthesis enzyme
MTDTRIAYNTAAEDHHAWTVADGETAEIRTVDCIPAAAGTVLTLDTATAMGSGKLLTIATTNEHLRAAYGHIADAPTFYLARGHRLTLAAENGRYLVTVWAAEDEAAAIFHTVTDGPALHIGRIG